MEIRFQNVLIILMTANKQINYFLTIWKVNIYFSINQDNATVFHYDLIKRVSVLVDLVNSFIMACCHKFRDCALEVQSVFVSVCISE